MIRDQKTTLTSLKWGQDQPDGGDSGLPYIKTNMPENSSAIERLALETSKFSSDFPIRGGFYALRAMAEDTIRIRKFLTDFPKGSNFTQKQVSLQKSNPLIETGKNGGRINTRTYNLNSNLLFSIMNHGNGENYPRPGSTPFTLLDDDNKYFSIVGKKPTERNRLVNLYNTKIIKLNSSISNNRELGISDDDSEIMNYDGGPGSNFGLGSTIIRRATDYRGLIIDTNSSTWEDILFNRIYVPLKSEFLGLSKIYSNIYSKIGKFDINAFEGVYKIGDEDRDEITNFGQTNEVLNKTNYNTMSYEQILEREQFKLGSIVIPQDFRRLIGNKDLFSRDYTNSDGTDRNDIPMTTRVGIGSPGSRLAFQRSNVNIRNEAGIDEVNISPIYYKPYTNNVEEDNGARDLIKFAFEIIDNDNTDNTYRAHFRALLKSFTDSNGAEWDPKRYSGRGENMYNYKGYNREISFSFIVYAQSKQEMKVLWQKLNYLNSTLAPDYNNEGFMRGNICRMTIGEYLYRTPGILKSLNFTVNMEYPWEIKMDEPANGDDDDMMELPHGIDVSVSFTPIMNNLPRTITTKNQNIGALISNTIGQTENFINKSKYIREIAPI